MAGDVRPPEEAPIQGSRTGLGERQWCAAVAVQGEQRQGPQDHEHSERLLRVDEEHQTPQGATQASEGTA